MQQILATEADAAGYGLSSARYEHAEAKSRYTAWKLLFIPRRGGGGRGDSHIKQNNAGARRTYLGAQ